MIVPLVKTQGIVLKVVNMGEADKIITLFTDSLGKISAIAHGARKPKSKFMSSTQVFAYCEYVLYTGKNLYTVNQSEIIESFSSCLDDLYSLTYCSYMLELTDALTQNGESNTELFMLLLKCMYLMNLDDLDRELLVRAFELKAVSISGYMPSLDRCSVCGENGNFNRFSIKLGGVICDRCLESDRSSMAVHPASINVMKYLLNVDIEKVRKIKVPADVKKEMKKILKNYIEYYLERNFRSLDFLEDVQNIDKI